MVSYLFANAEEKREFGYPPSAKIRIYCADYSCDTMVGLVDDTKHPDTYPPCPECGGRIYTI